MHTTPVKLLDVVALLARRPEEGLVVGQVSTVVEVFGPDVFEVEFLDSKGKTIAVTELKRSEVLVLKHEAAVAA
jgi:catabolite regulation protein CreA